jgi:hypothetical protein
LLPIAFILGIVGLFLSGKAKGTSIAAVIVSIIGTAVGVVVFLTVASDAFKDAFHKSDLSASSPTSADASKDGNQPGSSPEEIQASVIDTCQDAVKKDLKDPDSARFRDDWKAWEITAPGSTPPPGMTFDPSAGDKYYNAGGQVNAKNGFGGYAGDEPYMCDAIATNAGNIHARARSMADLLNPSG